jgi:hypothetical protein
VFWIEHGVGLDDWRCVVSGLFGCVLVYNHVAVEAKVSPPLLAVEFWIADVARLTS